MAKQTTVILLLLLLAAGAAVAAAADSRLIQQIALDDEGTHRFVVTSKGRRIGWFNLTAGQDKLILDALGLGLGAQQNCSSIIAELESLKKQETGGLIGGATFLGLVILAVVVRVGMCLAAGRRAAAGADRRAVAGRQQRGRRANRTPTISIST